MLCEITWKLSKALGWSNAWYKMLLFHVKALMSYIYIAHLKEEKIFLPVLVCDVFLGVLLVMKTLRGMIHCCKIWRYF